MSGRWAASGRAIRARTALAGAALASSAAAVASAALLFTPAAATAQTTLGPPLSQAPDVNFDCTVIPYSSGFAQGGQSCSWGTPELSQSGNAGGLLVPADGTISQVMVRVGASTGPMEVVILRTYFSGSDPSDNVCCAAEAVSPTFTPTANGVTTESVSLPVGEGFIQQDNLYYDDAVGLSILEDGVQIPLVDETSMPVGEQAVDTFNAPALTPGGSQDAGDPAGYVLDMQAVWSASASGGATANAIPSSTPSSADGQFWGQQLVRKEFLALSW
jgi:hypothetical protein